MWQTGLRSPFCGVSADKTWSCADPAGSGMWRKGSNEEESKVVR